MEDLFIIIKYIFLGFVQGFTEPIPISSSGHLIILRDLFSLHIEGLSFEILVNFASLLAILFIYRKDILRLVRNGTTYIIKKDSNQSDDFRFIVYLIIATIPTGVFGLLFKDFIEQDFTNIKMIGISLFITGIALWMIRNLRGRKNDRDLTIKDALIIGFAQTIALIPGISRSGATIVAAMFLGMKQETALRFSFLLYIPVSFGVMFFSFFDLWNDVFFKKLWILYTLAFLTSLITSFFALKWFMNIMKKGNLKYFSIYCFIVSILIFYFA